MGGGEKDKKVAPPFREVLTFSYTLLLENQIEYWHHPIDKNQIEYWHQPIVNKCSTFSYDMQIEKVKNFW